MKFSLIALAGALTAANAAASDVPKTFELNGKRNLRRDDASTEALLQKAVPYNRKNINRHLQEEEDDNAAEAEQREEANEEAAASSSKASKATKTPKVAKSGGGGGCAWPIDEFLCQQGNPANLAIKYTACPTADQVEKDEFGKFYIGVDNPPFRNLEMDKYLNSKAYMDQFGDVVVLDDDGSVYYEDFGILSATYC